MGAETEPGASKALVKAGASPKALLADVRGMILEARQTVARGVNAALVALYWKIGQRIGTDILKQKRAGYTAIPQGLQKNWLEA